MKLLIVLMSFIIFVGASRYEFGAERPGFARLGSYDGSNLDGSTYKKVYYKSHNFKVHWDHALTICNAYGMEMLSLESSQEESHFIRLCNQYGDFHAILGATSTAFASTTKWYWVNSGKKVNFPLNFSPGEPNNAGNGELCLNFGTGPGKIEYNDIPCFGDNPLHFVCQDYQEEEEAIPLTTSRFHQ